MKKPSKSKTMPVMGTKEKEKSIMTAPKKGKAKARPKAKKSYMAK